MDLKATKLELENAYKRMDQLEKQVSNLVIERRHDHLIIDVLKAAGFLNDKKISQARDIIMGFDS